MRENGLRFAVVPGGGQKTGHFCDQRPNRALVRSLAAGRRVLDAFAYSGGFGVHAGAGGAARVVAGRQLGAARWPAAARNWALNDLDDGARRSSSSATSPRFLRECDETLRPAGARPAGPGQAAQGPAARRARLQGSAALGLAPRRARRAARAPSPARRTSTRRCSARSSPAPPPTRGARCSCSQHLGPGPDHPVALGHPEGEYLHGLLLRVRVSALTSCFATARRAATIIARRRYRRSACAR